MSSPSFKIDELLKLQNVLGKEVWTFPCNLDKQPIVKFSDPRTHLRGVCPDKITEAVYAVPAKGNDLVFIDIDTDDVERQKMIINAFPKTFTVKSGRDGGGYHLYYWATDEKTKNFVDQHKNIGFDIKSPNGEAGGYVIAPGSWHNKGGKHYHVVRYEKIVSISAAKIREVQVYMSRVRREGEGRNTALFQFLKDCRTKKGYDDSAIEAAASKYNSTYFIPALDDREVRSVVQGILSLEPTQRGKYANDLSVFEDYIEHTPEQIQFAGSYYIWSGTHWRYTKLSDIYGSVQRYVMSREDIVSSHEKKGLSGMIGRVSAMVSRHTAIIFDTDPFGKLDTVNEYVNLQNGAWYFPTGGKPEFIPRTAGNEERLKRMYLNYCLPFDYNSEAEGSPTFDKYIGDLIEQIGANDDVIRAKHFLEEIMAYGVFPIRPLPYFLLIYGGEGTGKSRLPLILAEIVGDRAYLQRSMKHMIDGRFSSSDLLDKLVYVDDDLAENTTIPGDFLKTLAGETVTTVERKGKDSFSARLSVFPILLSNTRPNNTGAEGLRRRAIVIHIKQKFDGPKDLFLVPKISGRVEGFHDERPAIFNRLITAWARLFDRGFEFDPPRVVEETKNEWIADGDAVSSWLLSVQEVDGLHEDCLGKEMYDAYVTWSKGNGFRAMNVSNFYARIESIGYIRKKKTKEGIQFHGPRITLPVVDSRDF